MRITSFVLVLLYTAALASPATAQFDFVLPTELETKVSKLQFSEGHDKAVAYLDKYIEKNQKSVEPLILRAGVYAYKKDFDNAIKDIERALLLEPTNAELFKLRARYKTDRYRIDPQGRAVKDKSDFSLALADLELARQHGYDSETILFLQAGIHERLKDTDSAIRAYESIVTINPQSINARMEASRLKFKAGHEEKAISDLAQFLDDLVKARNGKLPKVVGEKVKRGSINEDTPVISQSTFSPFANSSKQLKRVNEEFRLAKNFAEAQVFLGLMRMKRLDFDSAIVALDTALLVDKNQFNAHGLKGKIHLARKEYQKAIAELTEAIGMANIPLLYIDRGISHMLNNNQGEAEKDFKSVLRICSDCKIELDKRIKEAEEIKASATNK